MVSSEGGRSANTAGVLRADLWSAIRRVTGSDSVFYAVNSTILTLFLLAVLYPLVYILSSSFSSTDAVMTGRVWLLPVDLSLQGYRAVFRHSYVWIGYRNTVIYTVSGTFLNVVLTILAAYPLSRRKLHGRTVVMFYFFFTMIFSGGLIPTYMLVNRLGLINTRWAMILPTGVHAFNIIIARTFYQSTIPDSLLEAAKMDGCSDIRFLISVVLPLSSAITGVLVLFYAVGHWNAFFNAFLYLSSRQLFPLQIILRDILILNTLDLSTISFEEFESKRGLGELLKYSLIVVSSAPILCLYPFVQRYFVRGVMIGSIKG